MRTKALVRFLNRAARFDADLELADVVHAAINDGALTPPSGKPLLLYVEAAKHPRLSTQKPCNKNRLIVTTHLKATLYAAYIKDLYEDLTAYLTELIASAARRGFSPDQLIGEHALSLQANELLKCGGWDQVVDLVAESLFRKLEAERSTVKLLERLDKKLGLGVDPDTLKSALPYLELRHLLVHADGRADERFCAQFPDFGAVVDEPVPLGHEVARDASSFVRALVEHYDALAIAADLIPAEDLQ